MKNFEIGELFYIPYIDRMAIPQDELKNLHKAYWTYIADTGVSTKPIIFSSITNKLIGINSKCFACEYAARQLMHPNQTKCKNCPLKIYQYAEYACCDYYDTLFMRWDHATDLKERKQLALEIANLEWEDI